MARNGTSMARILYGNRFSNSYMKNGMPNFARVARAYGRGLGSKTLKIYITLWKTIKI
jgi:hypothetical protein